jgi:hypothetical protein
VSTSEPDDTKPQAEPGRPSELPPGEPAIAVETVIKEDRGQYLVEIVVVFADGVVNRTVNQYRTRRHAEIAASWIKRGAERDIEGPIHG